MSVLPDQHVINQIISGHYADPFSLLGMHSVSAGLEVRALLPDADQVWVIDVEKGKQVAELRRYDDRGFLSALFPVVKMPSATSWKCAGARIFM